MTIIIIMIIIEQNRKFSLESKLILFLEVLKKTHYAPKK